MNYEAENHKVVDKKGGRFNNFDGPPDDGNYNGNDFDNYDDEYPDDYRPVSKRGRGGPMFGNRRGRGGWGPGSGGGRMDFDMNNRGGMSNSSSRFRPRFPPSPISFRGFGPGRGGGGFGHSRPDGEDGPGSDAQPLMRGPWFNGPPGMMGNRPPLLGSSGSRHPFPGMNMMRPSMMRHPMLPGNSGGGDLAPGGAGGQPPLDPSTADIWVETKSSDGKSYYYHARTRETTWTKPDGPNVKVISQEHVDAMASTVPFGGPGMGGAPNSSLPGGESKAEEGTSGAPTAGPIPGMMPPPGMMHPPGMNMMLPPGMMPPFGPGMPPQFGLPPPGGFPPPGFPGFPPAPGMPWGMPMNMPPPVAAPVVPTSVASATVGADAAQTAATMSQADEEEKKQSAAEITISASASLTIDDKNSVAQIDPEIIAKASEWTEHKAPDGRSYYYKAKENTSVWEKPQAIKDLENAKMALTQGGAGKSAINEKNDDGGIGKRKSRWGITSTGNRDDEGDRDNKANSSSSPQRHDPQQRQMLTQQQEQQQLLLQQQKEQAEAHEEQRKKVEAQATTKVSKPVSSNPVAGTPWCVVWTGDARVFFYNPSTRTSIWDRPAELADHPDVDSMLANPPAAVLALRDTDLSESTTTVTKTDSVAKTSTAATVSAATATTSTVSTATMVGPQQQSHASTANEKKQIDVGKDAAMEAEMKAARERAVIPLEDRINSFREMLVEKDVSAFSTWEKELHKIVFDARYLLLTSKERKQTFEKYVKERAEQERQEKRNKLRMRKDQFRELMEEAKLHSKSSFTDFSAKYGKDDRFKNIEKNRERESLFNEYILDVRRKEKEEKAAKREQVRKDFMELLKENAADIDRYTRWGDIKKKLDGDERYKAVDSSTLREDYFRDYARSLRDESRRGTDKDSKDYNGGSVRRDKERHRSSKRSRSRSRRDDTKERENKDNGTEDNDNGQTDEKDDKDTLEPEPRDKQAAEKAALKEREKEVQRTLAVHLRERDAERDQHKRTEAVQHFDALLADLIRNTDLGWREARKLLRKDSRWDLADLLDRDEKEKLYDAHIDQLTNKKREKLRELFDETPDVNLASSWKDVKKLIKDDSRYLKFSSSDRKCEREFREYLRDKMIAAKADFRELLSETKTITHKSLSQYRENEEGYLKEIEAVLSNDRRYLVLNHIDPLERTDFIVSYFEELEKRGPPPPPTASEPSRRVMK